MGDTISLNGIMGHCCLSYCLSTLFLFFMVYILSCVIGFQKSSLSEVPGPWLAKWTRLWIAKTLSSGLSHEVWTEMNTKYGLLVRIGPKHVVTDDPADFMLSNRTTMCVKLKLLRLSPG